MSISAPETCETWVICRICLKSSQQEMQYIFYEGSELCTQIRDCMGLQLLHHAKLPNKMCSACQLLLRGAIKFRRRCFMAQQQLSQLMHVPAFKESSESEIASQETKENVIKMEQDSSNDTVSVTYEVENVYDNIENFTAVEVIMPEAVLRNELDTTEPNFADEFPSTLHEQASVCSVSKPNTLSTTTCSKRQSLAIHSNSEATTNKQGAHVCNICGNVYAERVKLSAHMKIHSDNKPHECEICHKRFRQTPQLARHMNSHTGNRPYKCNFCDSCFADPSTCIKHQRIHTNERPYRCDVCGKSFAYSNVLKVHMKTHTGEKPFSCRYCQRCFTQLHHKKAHERSHNVDSEQIIYTDEE